MDSKELQELLKLVNRLELAEFKYKQGDLQFSVRTKFYMNAHPGMEGMTQYVQMPSPPAISATSPMAPGRRPPGRKPSRIRGGCKGWPNMKRVTMSVPPNSFASLPSKETCAAPRC